MLPENIKHCVAELQKVLDLPPNQDFKVTPSSFQSFVKIRKKSVLYAKKVLIDLPMTSGSLHVLETIACSLERSSKTYPILIAKLTLERLLDDFQ